MSVFRAGSSPARADARRNREAILQAAVEAFAQEADVVGLDDIAQRTGLGRATVYRHFPDRVALADAVAGQYVEALRELVDGQGVETYSFRDVLRVVLTMQAARRPLVRVFRQLPVDEQMEYAEAMVAVLHPAFEDAKRAGGLRPDAELSDLVVIFEMVEVALTPGSASEDHVARGERLVQVILDGLFTGPDLADKSDICPIK